MINNHHILVIGTGNTIRGDDGIGAYVCAGIDKAGIEGVHTRVLHQLHTELLEDFIHFKTVIIVDASVTGEAICFEPVEKKRDAAGINITSCKCFLTGITGTATVSPETQHYALCCKRTTL